MISATSSLASGILSGTFGTPAPAKLTIPTAANSSSSSVAQLLSASLGSDNSSAALLSNIAFAQDTLALLDDPHDNGAITGTPSNYVQQIINALAPGSTPTATPATANTSTTSSALSNSPADSSASTLPADGILA